MHRVISSIRYCHVEPPALDGGISAKYLSMRDKTPNFFERLRDKMVPIIIAKRRALGETEREIEDFIDLYSWVGPAESVAKVNGHKP